ncbi:MAG: hypothetical protein ACREQV_18160 [Candidatus Binatia bacterium]
MLHTENKRAIPHSRKTNGSVNARFVTPAGSNYYTIRATAQRSHTDVVEKIASLFERDTLAVAQYFDNLRSKSLVEPEKKLMLAILEDAVNCFQENVLAESGKGNKLFDEAQEWFLEGRGDWIFSFRNVCELLALNPEYLRGGLMRWKENKLAQRTPRIAAMS